jgi:hypothetical protein
MSNGTVLELSTLPVRHPTIGAALLDSCAASVIVRLSIDPTPQRAGTTSRGVEVNWRKRPGGGSAERVLRDIGWSDQARRATACEQLSVARNAEDITEAAGIGLAALLIHDIEEGVIQAVLPIGSGGDYLVRVSGQDSFIQLEMSGLRVDETGRKSAARLSEKTDQVLSKARVGFVSVTTFSHGPHAIVHSYLHFVRRARQKPKKKPGDGRKGGKK